LPAAPERRGGGITLTLVVACAAALRLLRVQFGLPDFLEEAIPFRLALAMTDVTTGAVDWNPHDFHYPSLSIYLHFVVQLMVFGVGLLAGAWHSWAEYVLSYTIDPTRMVIAARLVGITCDVLTVVAAWRIGERIRRGVGLPAALLVALAPVLVTTARSIYCDSVMTALAAWSVERMIAWHGSRRFGDLVLAASLAGLAAGAKYPAGTLVIPMGFLIWRRFGASWIAPWLAMTALAAAVFVATTPFALLDPYTFWRDLSLEGGHAATGHLGSIARPSFLFHLSNLTASLGWAGLALLAFSIALPGLGRERRSATFALWLALLGFAVPISLAHIDADRYLAPVIPIAAALAAGTAVGVLDLIPRFDARWGSALATLALVAPVLPGALGAAAGGAGSTQLEARRWCDAHLPREALLLQEGYSARLPGCLRMQEARGEPAYRRASAAVRARFDAIPCFHVVALPLQVSGAVVSSLAPPRKPRVVVPVVAHASELNRVFYDPRLFAEADYVMTSGAVRGRFEADPARYPAECALYRLLDERAEVVTRFAPRAQTAGPEIVVYRIGPGFREAPEAAGGIDPHWWAEAIPAAYRRRAQELLAPGQNEAWAGADSTFAPPPVWVQSLAPVYAGTVQALAAPMANELALLGRDEPARALARATLEVRPGNVEASETYAVCSGRMGRWGDARRATERTLAAAAGGVAEPGLVLAHARALAHTGERAGAMQELQALSLRLAENDPVGREARRMIAELAQGRKAGPVAGANP
jgi:hypothetical protein